MRRNGSYDLDKAYAELERYFQRIELADLGKVPVPQNSDIPSSDDEILGGERSSRIRKQKEVFSPPQPARRSRIVVEHNSTVLTRATQSRVTYPKKLSSKEAAEGSRDIISNPSQALNLDIMVSTKTDNQFNGATVERPNAQCRKRNAEIPAASTYVVPKLEMEMHHRRDDQMDDDSDYGTTVNLPNKRGVQPLPYNRLCTGSAIRNWSPNENGKKYLLILTLCPWTGNLTPLMKKVVYKQQLQELKKLRQYAAEPSTVG
ncbi:Uncharacterized protein APZ42_031169 [Daphnia magna]|uniref:Uncharacterized protein n=1 Tax=Daphnia magna TaxID=35525 RepID=A0A164N309_9CRUS|nr:Uncharacterized protein APZ42_031169 [Daphnia magna]